MYHVKKLLGHQLLETRKRSPGLRRGSLRFPLRSKRRLVGAAGFEPTTFSAQG